MTREEYFVALKNNIQSLSLDEQNEALQYYSDYFDDAGDDEKTMEELGSPEEVAAIIREKFSNALVKQGKTSEKSETENGDFSSWDDGLFYSFNPADVKNLDFGFGAAEVVFIRGKNYSVETRGVEVDGMKCCIDNNGTLIVKNTKKLAHLKFWNHERSSRVVPRILVSIPENASVNFMKLTLGAGKFTAKNISVKYKSGIIDLGAGNLILKNISGEKTAIRCGMGNLEIEGLLTGRTDIDCGMGAVKLNLNQNSQNCSYDAKIGLGSFRFNDFKKGGVGNCVSEKRENHFSVNVGMGDVSIFTK